VSAPEVLPITASGRPIISHEKVVHSWCVNNVQYVVRRTVASVVADVFPDGADFDSEVAQQMVQPMLEGIASSVKGKGKRNKKLFRFWFELYTYARFQHNCRASQLGWLAGLLGGAEVVKSINAAAQAHYDRLAPTQPLPVSDAELRVHSYAHER
jgi:hypothetical protein